MALLICCISTVLPLSLAQELLDASFGSGGKVTTPIGISSSGLSVVVQTDGKILVAGSAFFGVNAGEFALVRYTPTGALDTSFGNGGKVTTPIGSSSSGRSMVVQTDGKILVAGSALDGSSSADFALVRYTASGALDGGFGTGGKVITDLGSRGDFGYSVALQSDGKIIVSGVTFDSSGSHASFALVRYTAMGALDTSFGSGGKVTTPIGSSSSGRSMVVQTDGKVLVAGSAYDSNANAGFALARYTAEGALDTNFGSGGIVVTDLGSGSRNFGYSVAVQSDGRILLSGYSGGDFALLRYTIAGTLDTTFGSGGKVTTSIGNGDDRGYSVAVQSDGKILVAGYSYNGNNDDFALVRYTATGALDPRFGSFGKVTTNFGGISFDQAYSVALQSDGKILAVGTSADHFAVVRYLPWNPASISGVVFAGTAPSGTIWVAATPNPPDPAASVSIAAPGAFAIPTIYGGITVNVFAFLDANDNGIRDPWESAGDYTGNPLLLDSAKTGIDITISVPVDSDGDGLPDAWETASGLVVGVNDALLDKDGDGLSNIQELYLGTNPSVQDSDGDGVFDGVEYAAGMNPLSADTDGDGLPDAWELANGLNPPVNDAALDADGDGLTNLEEFNGGVNSTNPRSRDSNGDGVSDYEERNGVKPTAHSYDRLDRLVATQYPNGAWEGWQYDGNGNIRAHVLRATRDADGDSLPDAWEFSQGLAIANATGTQGFAGDADGDGWTNYQEFLAGTNPNDSASQPPAGGAPGAVWFNPPKARIVLPPAAGGGLAHVSLKLWDAEGNPAQTVLQWFDSATQQWKPATVTRVNGVAFSGTPLITAPAGTTHDVLWNALADLGAFNGIALLRATAQDAAGMTISETVPFAVNTTGDFDSDGLPDAWEIPNGLDPNDATAANGFNGDLDGDGFANLAEFAFNLNPRAADATGKPAVTTAVNPADGKRYLFVTYQRRTGTPALLYDIQTTNELGTWTTNGADLEPVSVVPSGFMETVTVRIHPPLGSPGTPAKFVRIRIRVQ